MLALKRHTPVKKDEFKFFRGQWNYKITVLFLKLHTPVEKDEFKVLKGQGNYKITINKMMDSTYNKLQSQPSTNKLTYEFIIAILNATIGQIIIKHECMKKIADSDHDGCA